MLEAVIIFILLLIILIATPIVFGLFAVYIGVSIGKIFTGAGSDTLTIEDAMALEYPFRRLIQTHDDLIRAYKLVCEYKLHFVIAGYNIINIPELSNADKQLYGKSLLISCAPSDYYNMNWMSDWFNERCRLACRRYDNDLSPLDYWAANKAEIVNTVSPLTIEKLNDYVYERVPGCNNFRPGLMSGFIRHFRAQSVLDFSSGWGDRLIGAIGAGARYVGVDPNICLQDGYAAIINEFSGNAQMICSPFQSADLPDEKFDLVFTSPPYFDLEVYSTDSTQSINEFSSLDTWFEDFLMVSLRKCWAALNSPGYMVIIINNIRNQPDFVMRMIRAVSEFADCEYLGVVPYADKVSESRYKSPQPMWIWRKGPPLIRIEELSREHIDQLAEITSEPDVMQYIASGKTWDRAKLLSLIEFAESDSSADHRQYYHWVILRDGWVIGYIGLYPLGEIGLQLRQFITSSAQGKGFGKQALTQLLANAPTRVIYSQMRKDNIPSMRLMESVGMHKLDGNFTIGNIPVERYMIEIQK